MTDLKLIALDEEDLAVLSAHLQDAVLKVGDMAWLPAERRFAAVLNRFDWAASLQAKRRTPKRLRRLSALRLDRVSAARLQGIDLKAKGQVLSLLAITFEPGHAAPAGHVTLRFAGGGALQLDVDCIEAQLRDLGAVWAARAVPNHGGESDEK